VILYGSSYDGFMAASADPVEDHPPDIHRPDQSPGTREPWRLSSGHLVTVDHQESPGNEEFGQLSRAVLTFRIHSIVRVPGFPQSARGSPRGRDVKKERNDLLRPIMKCVQVVAG